MTDSIKERIPTSSLELRPIDDARVTQRLPSRLVRPRYVPLLHRIRENPEALLIMVEQVTDCLDALFHGAHILHGDISVNSIVWSPTESASSEGNFVLCDFDTALNLDQDGFATVHVATRPRWHRTGTLPFLAIELIKSPETIHRLYHNYESLFWVVLWCAMKADYHEVGTDRKAIDELLNKWESIDPDVILLEKMDDLVMSWNKLPIPSCFKTPKNIKTLMRKFRALIQEAPNKVDMVQLEEENEFGREIQDRGDIMDTIICKKSIKDILKDAAKLA
ncbi:hypothetical protein ACG7TL_007974 [Trametes sanguinea]